MKIRQIELSSLPSGPGYNSKTGSLESMHSLRMASRSISTLQSKWNGEIQPFIDLIPSSDEVDPFILGLTGEAILLDSLAKSSHPFYWNGSRSKTVFECVSELQDSSRSIKENLENLGSHVAKIMGLDIKKRFSKFPDVPSTYFHNQYLKVKSDESGLEATDSLVADNSFLGLKDTPFDYSGSSGQVVSTLLSQGGVVFQDEEPLRLNKSAQLASAGSTTFTKEELANKTIYITRDGGSQTFVLEATFDGAEVVFRIDNAVAGSISISGDSSPATIESEPVALNDFIKFLHLVYDESNSTYYILGYH